MKIIGDVIKPFPKKQKLNVFSEKINMICHLDCQQILEKFNGALFFLSKSAIRNLKL